LEFNYYTSSSTPSPLPETNKLTLSYQDLLSSYNDYFSKDPKKLVFPTQKETSQKYKSESSRGGKSLLFPTDSSQNHYSTNRLPFEKTPMIFPDRTGTGDLRLDIDEYGDYKTVYYESQQHRDSSRDPQPIRGLRQVAFPQEMHFPQ